MLDFEIPVKEIEKRKQIVRNIWEYKKADHIPVMLNIVSNPNRYTMHDEIFSKEKQLQMRLASIKKTLELVPDDYIPGIFVNMGCVGIENALGMEIYYGETPRQTPGVRDCLLKNIEDIYSLKSVNPEKDGILPQFLERMRYFAQQTEHRIPLSCLDMNGPMAVAMDIIGSENVLIGMYDHPDDIKYLLHFVMDNILLVTDACIEAAGGIHNITCTDFCEYWFPEGKKGHVSDDVSAMIHPDLFQEFSIPVNSRIFKKYGPGLLHNCGPNPCAGYYLEHTPVISGVDLSYEYSKDDLPKFRKPFKGRGIIYLSSAFQSYEQTIADYNHIIHSLLPDVIAIPSITIEEADVLSGNCNPEKLYEDLRKMSEGYASNMDW